MITCSVILARRILFITKCRNFIKAKIESFGSSQEQVRDISKVIKSVE